MSAMAANMRVASPVQIAVGHEKPADKQPSGGDDRFSNMLSQRQPREETPPTPRIAPKQKNAEPAKQKDDKPDDTLQLLQTSTAIQPSVTPPAQTGPSTQTQTLTDAVDDILAKPTAKVVSQPPINMTAVTGTPVASGAASTGTADNATLAAPPAESTSQIAQLLLQATTPAQKPVVDSTVAKTSTATATAAQINVAASPRAKAPTARAFEASVPVETEAPAPKTNEATASAPPVPLIANAAPQGDVPAAHLQAAQSTNVPQQPAVPAAQLDFSNAAPIIVATAIAATATHHPMLRDDASDDSLNTIDTASPSGALPAFSVPEHHDIATVDGKVPVPAPSSPQFGDALGAKLSWMAERHIGHAEIRLSPDDLGTIDVRVRLNGEHVRAEFDSANADVRRAINTHLPRLRDMLSQHGFNLAESHVGNGSNPQTSQSAPDDPAIAPVEDEVALPAPRIPAYAHDGILDAFA